MIRIGTSGYSYDDWVGPVYPTGTDKRDFLSIYAQKYRTVEINYTYYRPPSAQTLAQMMAKTPDDFTFTLKATNKMTHERSQDPDIYRQYSDALAPLIDGGKFGCILLQFPNSFKLHSDNVAHLVFIRQQWPQLPLVVEFRHRSWVEDERTFDFLRQHRFGFCCVDQPQFSNLLPPIAVTTSDVAYVRFHGRNYDKWWKHDEAWERYDYLYSRDELREWLPRVRQLNTEAETTYLFFNNHYHGSAAQNALEFAELLAG
jgi:uncharacterized protein YecE (DUF72 family)